MLVLILAAMRLKLPGERQLWVHLVIAALLANAIPYTLFGVAEQTVDSNLAGAINATTPLRDRAPRAARPPIRPARIVLTGLL